MVDSVQNCRTFCCGASWNKILTLIYAVLLTAAHALLVCASFVRLLYGPLSQSWAPLLVESALTLIYATAAIGVLLKCDCLLRLYKWTLLSCGASVCVICTAYVASEFYDWTRGSGSAGLHLNSLLRAILYTVIIARLLTHAYRTTEKYREEIREQRQQPDAYHLIKNPADIVCV
ncbi:hypothetical protein PFISCL1PPCAC_13227 [Pristionchus fissidentatus]|uniref:Uncharacterized protein n=1 Tax=Pristionchus fissidentatus TaxID=1538716 RepID=A0AAV5VV44_9BILA|nr:hypothetical protein PFISCL1PPCAC_13227 [Pristionchus fissidentatus]